MKMPFLMVMTIVMFKAVKLQIWDTVSEALFDHNQCTVLCLRDDDDDGYDYDGDIIALHVAF